MRHRKVGVKLNRTTSHRQAMFRNMVTSLLKHQRIRTTDVKAKELRRWADHVITLAKRGDLHARRQVLAIVREKDVAHKLFAEAQERFGNINGGYTRIVKIGLRAGDAAPISLIELVALQEKAPKGKKKAKKGGEKAMPEAPKPAATAAAEKTAAQKPATEVAPETLDTAVDEAVTDTAAPQAEASANDTPAREPDAESSETPSGDESEAPEKK
ncbi:50S ribosomal protein L17 [Desulfatitalea alkaliphila]|uniref:50S ribosomal protein L17 n=1 Tax=Desulfatitalea alkaliphila TaxID=2929485 RepID=UPI003CCF7597